MSVQSESLVEMESVHSESLVEMEVTVLTHK